MFLQDRSLDGARRRSRPPASLSPARAFPLGSPASILALQRSAGNAAVQRHLARPGHPFVQRDGESATSDAPKADAPKASRRAGDVSAEEADREATFAEIRPLVEDAIAMLGPAAQTVIRVPPPKSAAVAQTVHDGSAPIVQRDGSGGARYHPEGGLVASVQLCYDLMTGEIELIGWIWAGAGYKTPFGWYGGFVFAEGRWPLGNVGAIVSPGVCRKPTEHHDGPGGSVGGGVAPFPVMLTPGKRAVFAKGGIELGILFSLTGDAERPATIEIIGLIDVKKYLGPFGVAAAAAEEAAKRIAAGLGQRVDCGAGFDLSLAAPLCKAADPNSGILGYTTDSLKLCGGGFIGCNINLSKSRAALPGGGH